MSRAAIYNQINNYHRRIDDNHRSIQALNRRIKSLFILEDSCNKIMNVNIDFRYNQKIKNSSLSNYYQNKFALVHSEGMLGIIDGVRADSVDSGILAAIRKVQDEISKAEMEIRQLRNQINSYENHINSLYNQLRSMED